MNKFEVGEQYRYFNLNEFIVTIVHAENEHRVGVVHEFSASGRKKFLNSVGFTVDSDFAKSIKPCDPDTIKNKGVFYAISTSGDVDLESPLDVFTGKHFLPFSMGCVDEAINKKSDFEYQGDIFRVEFKITATKITTEIEDEI